MRFALSLLVAVGCLAVADIADAAGWQAGVARVKITPEQPMWMAGYAGRNRPADAEPLTDLWAKALVLRDQQGQQCVLVTLDVLGIPRDFSQQVCERLMKEHGLKRRAIVLSTTHTHSGPVIGFNLRPAYSLDETQAKKIAEYTQRLGDKIVETVRQATGNMQPATLAWGQRRCTFAVNRRNNKEADVPQLRAEGKLQGPVDHDAPVLAVRRGDKLVAVVAGYACHATVLSGYQWCADWPGYAALEIERQHPDAMALIWAGCGGDQNPLPRRKVELAQNYGSQLATSVEEVLKGEMRAISGEFIADYSEIDLGFSEIPTREDLQQTTESKNKYLANRARLLLAKLDRDGKLSETYPYPVQTWRLGNGPQWVVLGGEVTVDYALRLKSELGAERTWVTAYSNDVMAYIPSRRVLNEGGYEGGGAMVYYGLPSPWKPDVEESIVREVHRQAKQTAQ